MTEQRQVKRLARGQAARRGLSLAFKAAQNGTDTCETSIDRKQASSHKYEVTCKVEKSRIENLGEAGTAERI